MRALGTDLALDANGDLLVRNGDLDVIRGLECLQANLLDRMTTPEGDLLLHPRFGAGLPDRVSQPLSDQLLAFLKAEVKRQLQKDPRVEQVLSVEVQTVERKVVITAEVKHIGAQVPGNLVFPLEVEP